MSRRPLTGSCPGGRRLLLAVLVAAAACLWLDPGVAVGSWRQVVTLPAKQWPHGVTGVQNVGRYVNDAGAERWVVVRSSRGDAVLHRHDSRGRYLSTMVLKGAGHPSQTGMRISGGKLQVLLRWEFGGGSGLYWVDWRNGTTRRGDPNVHRLRIGRNGEHPALSPNRRWLVLRRQVAGPPGHRSGEQYRVVDYSTGRVVARFSRIKPAVHQGFAISSSGRYVYVLYGSTNGKSFLDRLNVRTGRLSWRMDTTRFCACNRSSREPEGLSWRHKHLLVSNREGGSRAHRVVTVGEVTR
jgi:hypothetical protein